MSNDENLRRGRSAKNITRIRDARAREREERRAVKASPDEALVRVHRHLTIGVEKLLRQWLRSGEEPSRALTDVLREFRASNDSVVELRRRRGDDAAAREFLAAVFDCVEATAPELVEQAVPLSIPPSDVFS